MQCSATTRDFCVGFVFSSEQASIWPSWARSDSDNGRNGFFFRNNRSRAPAIQFSTFGAACTNERRVSGHHLGFHAVRKTIVIQCLLAALEEFPLLCDVRSARLCRRPFASAHCTLEVLVLGDFLTWRAVVAEELHDVSHSV